MENGSWAKMTDQDRPPIFDERNRAVWDQVRRLLIWLLRQLDHLYGWKTFENKPTSNMWMSPKDN